MVNQIKQNEVIVPEVKKHLDDYLDWLIAEEKKEYHNDLVPFAQKEAEIRVQKENEILKLQNIIQQAMQIVKEFLEQDDHNKELYQTFEQSLESLKEKVKKPDCKITDLIFGIPLQEQMKLPWEFMDRCYDLAKHLLEEKKYDEAEKVFCFLTFLHPNVFEYPFGMAAAQQANLKYEDAIDSYTQSLFIQPNNPLPFFQLAGCYYQIKEMPSCLNSLECCVNSAKDNPEQASILKDASEAIQALGLKKVA